MSVERWRLQFVAGALCVLLMVAFGRLYQIQITHHEFLESRRTVVQTQQRGKIVDREGRPLATNEQAWDLYVNLPDDSKARRILLATVEAEFPAAAKALRKRDEGGFAYVARAVNAATVGRFRSLKLSATAGGAVPVWKRVYPYGAFAGQLLGFVGSEGHGLGGLEYSFDSLLRGDSEWSGQGQRPYNLRLTLDFEVQRRLEHLLAQKVAETGAQSALALVLEAGTGAVRAAAQYPEFNPGDFGKASDLARRNRIVTDAFEPGSTIKPFVIAEALATNTIKSTDIRHCKNGKWQLYDHEINDHEPRGWLTPRQILEVSSNICTGMIALELPGGALYDTLSNLGFGTRVQADFAGEARGIVRRPNRFSPVETVTMSFGQGLSVTPLQLAAAYNVFASGGVYYKPYFVDAFLDESMVPATVKSPEAVRQIYDGALNDELNSMLQSVVDTGTGLTARLEGVTIAGKTGTAQVPDLQNGGYKEGEYIALFAGFFPVENPRYTAVVVVEKPKGATYYGSQVAAPVFREVARTLTVYEGALPAVASRVPVAAAVRSARTSAVLANVVPQFEGLTLREALHAARAAGLRVQSEGSGLVVAQKPAAGTELASRIRTVTLTLSPEIDRAKM